MLCVHVVRRTFGHVRKGMRIVRQTITLLGLMAVAAAYPVQRVEYNRASVAVLYEGARLIAGDGSAPIEDSAFLVENGTIARVGRKGRVTAPSGAARVGLGGKTVMPTLINTHGHPGFQRGLTYTADNFTRETIIDDLNRALYFGVAAVQSHGIGEEEVTAGVAPLVGAAARRRPDRALLRTPVSRMK